MNAATSATREFPALDIATVEVPRKAVSGLSKRPDVRYVEENGTMHTLDPGRTWPQLDCQLTEANT